MAKIFLSIISLLMLSTASATAVSPDGGIVPRPRHAELRDGVFTILTTTQITHYSDLRPSACYLAEYLPLQVRQYNADSRGDIVLRIDKNLEKEGYILDISPEGITIDGGSAGGVHNGIVTLLQLLPAKIYSGRQTLPIKIECRRIEDAPRYAYRGFMLDVARTWMEADEVKLFIERLSHHKINKLHLHLADDEAWRIEILAHPELAQKGGFRGPEEVVAARYGAFDRRYGGYYTQAQMREIIEFAAARNIEIIPEIDLPGHSHTLARVRPEVLCRYTPDTNASLGYDTRDLLCVSREENYVLLEDVIAELAALFPSEYLHIGGDEVITSQWQRCPECQALMRRKGMSKPNELQHYFTARVSAIAARYGKRVGVWNEASEGGTLSKDALVYGWKDVAACRKAAAKGFETVVMPGAWFYFDMRQSADEAGHDWAAIFDVQKPLSFSLKAQGFTAEEMQNVAGFEGAFFSEIYLSHRDYDYNYIYHLTYPRICALSEVAWAGGGSWEEFYSRLRDSHYGRMEAMGIEFRLFPPKVSYSDGQLTASSSDGGTIYYTIEGENQGEHHIYTSPIKTTTPARYAFHTRRGPAFSPEAGVKERFSQIRPKFTLTSSITESERYKFSGVESYSRVGRTTRAGKQGDWILYTFDEAVKCRRMLIRTGNVQTPRYLFEAGYLEVSHDGKNFTRVCDLDYGCGIIENPSQPIKAVRVVCTQSGNGARFVTVQSPKVWPILK